MLKYAREPRTGEKVRCYRNLRNGKISIMDSKGRVIQHAAYVLLCNADFVVRQAGREKVLKEKRKNVHAFVVGSFGDSMPVGVPVMVAGDRIKYNPYKYSSFVRADNELPVKSAVMVRVDQSGLIMAIGVNYAR